MKNLDGLGQLRGLSGNLEISNNPSLPGELVEEFLERMNANGYNGEVSIKQNKPKLVDGFRIIEGDFIIDDPGDFENLKLMGEDAFIIQGDLVISGDEIVNLDNLEGLAKLQGSLIIENNTSLENIDGLLNLSVVSSISINNNIKLNNLDGLQGLKTIHQGITLSNNPSLDDIAGLANLQSVDGKISITRNQTLAREAIEIFIERTNAIGHDDEIDIRFNKPEASQEEERLAFYGGIGNYGFSGFIHAINIDGTNHFRLTELPSSLPFCSPDGKLIAFVDAHPHGLEKIHVMNADGSDQVQITPTTSALVSNPIWLPSQNGFAYLLRASAGDTDPLPCHVCFADFLGNSDVPIAWPDIIISHTIDDVQVTGDGSKLIYPLSTSYTDNKLGGTNYDIFIHDLKLSLS